MAEVKATLLKFDAVDRNGMVIPKQVLEDAMIKFAEMSKDGKVVFGELTHDGLQVTLEDKEKTLD